MTESIPNAGNCLASRTLLEEDGQVLWVWREKPLIPSDSGWRFLSDKDTQQTINPDEHMVMVAINDVIQIEPMIRGIYWYPIGSDFQFYSSRDDKHFVYNDTHERVILAYNLAGLPTQSQAFQTHFPNYQEPNVAPTQEKIVVAHVNPDAFPKKPVAPLADQTADKAAAYEETPRDTQTKPVKDKPKSHTYIPSIDDTSSHLSVAELKLLADARQEMKQLIKIWQKELNKLPSHNEQYVMTGLLLGYLAVRNREVPLEWPTRRNLIVNTFYDHYQISQDQIKLFIESYEARRDNPEHLAEIQIIRYGKAMYEWFWQGKRPLIQDQFGELIRHYT